MTPFVEHLAELYQHDHVGVAIDVQGLGSSAGIRAAAEGVSELGMSSRSLTDEETGQLDQLVIARDALAIIVHPSNPVKSLTSEQIRAVFTGKVTNWSELGGNARAIILVSREAGSGTYTAFEELVMEGEPIALTSLRQGSNGAVRQIVADDADAIGYISLGIVDATVQPVTIDQVIPSVQAVEEGSYQLVRPFLIVWRKGVSLSPLAQEFVGYVQSLEGQAELARGGLVPGGNAP
jgi:phosphate transport system substrate-binding protein